LLFAAGKAINEKPGSSKSVVMVHGDNKNNKGHKEKGWQFTEGFSTKEAATGHPQPGQIKIDQGKKKTQ